MENNEMGWACSAYGWGEGVYKVLLGKPEGRRTLGRPRRRWVDNIRIDLQELGCGYMHWIGLAQDTDRWRTLVSAVMNLRVPWNTGNFLTRCKPVSFSRRTLYHGVSKYVISTRYSTVAVSMISTVNPFRLTVLMHDTHTQIISTHKFAKYSRHEFEHFSVLDANAKYSAAIPTET